MLRGGGGGGGGEGGEGGDAVGVVSSFIFLENSAVENKVVKTNRTEQN